MTSNPTLPGQLGPARLQSVDFLRGVIMILMAIDHVRVYSGLPAGGPEPGIFFTRWVTHFCAPGFVFLAGTSAFLYGLKVTRKQLSWYLLTRGVLLVILELTLIRFFWTFNLNLSEFMLAGVIWMIGWCMVIMAAMIWLRPALVGWLGLLIVFGQSLFEFVPLALPESARPVVGQWWEFIYPAGFEAPSPFAVLYVIVPWIGVMMAGYGFGMLLSKDSASIRKRCISIGVASIALFVLIGTYLALKSEDGKPFIFALLDQRKYPASPLYLMMTLGPLILLVPFVDKLTGGFVKAVTIFGRVPFFYYLAHILIIHVSALVVHLVMFGTMHHEWYAYAPFSNVPEENRWPLWLLYIVFIIDVLMLYVVCAWYMKYKAKNPSLLTRYL